MQPGSLVPLWPTCTWACTWGVRSYAPCNASVRACKTAYALCANMLLTWQPTNHYEYAIICWLCMCSERLTSKRCNAWFGRALRLATLSPQSHINIPAELSPLSSCTKLSPLNEAIQGRRSPLPNHLSCHINIPAIPCFSTFARIRLHQLLHSKNATSSALFDATSSGIPHICKTLLTACTVVANGRMHPS